MIKNLKTLIGVLFVFALLQFIAPDSGRCTFTEKEQTDAIAAADSQSRGATADYLDITGDFISSMDFSGELYNGGVFQVASAAADNYLPVMAQAPSSTASASGSGKLSIRQGIVVYPKPGTELKVRRTTIGADFQYMAGFTAEIEPRLLLDGRDVTGNCDVNPGYLFYRPAEDLADGTRGVVLELRRPGAAWEKAAEWNFSVIVEKPLKYAYPPAGAEVDKSKPMIGLNFDEFPNEIDPETVRLVLDGRDITSLCDVSSQFVFCSPQLDLNSGDHAVTVKAKAASGREMEPLKWAFAVVTSPDMAVAGAPPAAAETTPAEQPKEAAGLFKEREDKIARAIATAKRQDMSITRASRLAEKVIAAPAPEEQQVFAVAQGAQPTQIIVSSRTVVEAAPPEAEQETVDTMAYGFGETEYAMDTTYGFENVSVGGDWTRSSQRPKSAFVYRFGIRSQTYLPSSFKSLYDEPTFHANLRMEGTTDGDITESFWDLKNFTGIIEDKVSKFAFYDIKPRYTPYSLSGQRLYGGEFTRNINETATLHMFMGKFRTARAGKRIKLHGLRYSEKDDADGLDFGFQYVSSLLEFLRGGDSNDNSVMSFDLQKKYSAGETRLEWARSRFTDIGGDMAYKLENSYRKKKTYLSTAYESVGADFRTESGYASKGLVEFNSSFQYAYSSRLTTVFGFRRRSFRDGGSRTVSIPFVLRTVPFKKRPTTTFEYKYKLSRYDKGESWKDTFTNTYEARHYLGKAQLGLSFKKERKERNAREDENERLLNFSLKSAVPYIEKTDFSYKLAKLNNNFYGPEAKNSYTLTYELSDWSDISIGLDKINKDLQTLDRETKKLRFGKVNPEKNTEMNLEYKKNVFIDYIETMFSMKYSIFY